MRFEIIRYLWGYFFDWNNCLIQLLSELVIGVLCSALISIWAERRHSKERLITSANDLRNALCSFKFRLEFHNEKVINGPQGPFIVQLPFEIMDARQKMNESVYNFVNEYHQSKHLLPNKIIKIVTGTHKLCNVMPFAKVGFPRVAELGIFEIANTSNQFIEIILSHYNSYIKNIASVETSCKANNDKIDTFVLMNNIASLASNKSLLDIQRGRINVLLEYLEKLILAINHKNRRFWKLC